MFTELPKLFDRNFAIAHFLPAAVFGLAAWGILQAFGYGTAVEAFLKRDALVSAAIALVLVWLLALLLLALNFPVLRLYEGYGPYHPLRWRGTRYRERFCRDAAAVLQLQADIEAARKRGEDPTVTLDHTKRLQRAVNAFPDEVEWVLPTRLGNLFRAFEVYPRVVYGLDAIPAWPRLQAILPEHVRQMLADAKAQLDFCINLSLGSWLAAILYVGLALAHQKVPGLWVLVLALVIALGSYWLAASAAVGFGAHVKSVFDLYRADLAKQFGLELPRSADAERQMWQTVSRMMIYRSAARASELTRFRQRRPDFLNYQDVLPIPRRASA